MTQALVIGGGPAGLMAAESLAQSGTSVLLAEAKPTIARKFLMAGKSGLNITKSQALDDFIATYDCDFIAPMLREFGPMPMTAWCENLGQEMFTGSSGRVFPKAMKASPLLRAWAMRLDALGVRVATRWRWTGWNAGAFHFETPEGPQYIRPRVCVLALGGASWARLGSDGAWRNILAERGVDIAPFQPANMGLRMAWSAHMRPHFGSAIKGVSLSAGNKISRGEFIISARGIEGGGIYALSRTLREGAALSLDLCPDKKLKNNHNSTKNDSIGNRLRKLGLSEAARTLVLEFGRHLPFEQAVKALPIPHLGPRPIDEAISVAGGITASALTQDLELRAMPNVFACGEMLDWEAPTGGYLLTACFATGRWAGRAAATRL